MPAAAFWPLPAVIGPGAAGPLAPFLGRDDFLAGLQRLLPRGRAWSRDPDSVMTQFLAGIAVAQAQAHARQINLLMDAFPASTVELLPEWEASEGLPDPCTGVNASFDRRRQQVVARFIDPGGQTIDHFVMQAARLGVTVNIAELSNWRVDENGVDDSIDSPAPAIAYSYWNVGHSGVDEPLVEWQGGTPARDWDFALLITATQPFDFFWAVGDSSVDEPLSNFSEDPVATTYDFAVGDSDVNAPIAARGDMVLECELGRVLPGQSVAIFAYA